MIQMHIIRQRLGTGLAGLFLGVVLGAIMGFAGAYVAVLASADFLGFRDQDGLIILAGPPVGAIHGGVVGLLIGLGVRNIGGWVLGTLVGLTVWAPLFLLGAHHNSNVLAALALAMPVCGGCIGAISQACFTRNQEILPAEVIPEDALPVNASPLQIAGNKCKVCELSIIFSNEGKFCVHCGTVVHCSCEPRATCTVCGRPYQVYERPKVDLLEDAVIPPALRPGGVGRTAWVIIATTVAFLLILILWYSFEHSLEHLHGK
jgi:hypothetical protein